VGDIAADTDDTDDVPAVPMQRRQRRLHVPVASGSGERPFVGDCLPGQRFGVCRLVLGRIAGTDDFSNGTPDQSCRLDALALEPTTEGIHAALFPVQPEHNIVDRFNQVPKALLTGPQRVLGVGMIRNLPGVRRETVAGWGHSDGKPLAG
jgi:hypothetical protein